MTSKNECKNAQFHLEQNETRVCNIVNLYENFGMHVLYTYNYTRIIPYKPISHTLWFKVNFYNSRYSS